MKPRRGTRRFAALAVLLPVAAIVLVMATAGSRPEASGLAVAADIALRGATLIDGRGGPPVADAVVLLRGDRIVAAGPAAEVTVPPGVEVLDLSGRTILPGFIDTHAHVTILRWSRDARGNMVGTYDRAVSEKVLRTMLAHGITYVRNPAAPAADGVALRAAVAAAAIAGPDISTAGDAINAAPSEDSVRAEVRRQAALGVDWIKVGASLPPRLTAAAIDEAHRRGVRVVGHLQRTTWTDAARMGIDAITHGAPWSPEYLPEERRSRYAQTLRGRIDWLEWLDVDGPAITALIDALVEHGVPVDPTLIAYHTDFWADDPRYRAHPELSLVPELVEDWRRFGFTDDFTADDFARGKRLWPKVQALVRRYRDAGVLLAAGSDLPNPWIIPGVGFHEELQLLEDVGIPRAEVLTIATRNGARVLGVDSIVGTVEAGRRADLVILAADPLAALANTRRIELVIHRGRFHRPDDLLGR